MDWNSDHITKLIELALLEDCITQDVTSLCVVPVELRGAGKVIAREELVYCGGPLVQRIVEVSTLPVTVKNCESEGQLVADGTTLCILEGNMRALLSLERTALNFLQRLSGVATTTHRFVSQAHGLTVLDTRKTMPGWRLLDKYAVRIGGGHNHRMNLSDMILIKNNHIDAHAGDIKCVQALLDKRPSSIPVEVEVRTVDELSKVLKEMRPDRILLDNMDNEREGGRD